MYQPSPFRKIQLPVAWYEHAADCFSAYSAPFMLQVALSSAIRIGRTRHFSKWAHRDDTQHRDLRTHRQWQDHPHRANFVLHGQNKFHPRRAGKGTRVANSSYHVTLTLLPFSKPTQVNNAHSATCFDAYLSYKAFRSAGGESRPLRSLKNKKYNTICEADRGSRLIAGANWRLLQCEESRLHAPGNSLDTAFMSIPYAPGVLL